MQTEACDLLIEAGHVVPVVPHGVVLHEHAVAVRDGTIVASRDELIGRGHAERLVPMIEEMLDGHVPARILVGVGPGSFTGLRVGIAAAHGMAIGWSIPLSGMNSSNGFQEFPMDLSL